MRGGVAHHDLLGTARIEENVEDAVVIAGDAGVQQPIRRRRRLARSSSCRRAGKRNTEPHRVHLRQGADALRRCGRQSRRIVRRPQKRLQLLRGVVIEAEVGGGKSFLQHTGVDEQPQRGALHAVRRTDQHFTFAFEVSAGDTAIDRLREGDRAVVEPQVHVFAVDLGFADLEDALRIEADGAQGAVKRQHRTGRERNCWRVAQDDVGAPCCATAFAEPASKAAQASQSVAEMRQRLISPNQGCYERRELVTLMRREEQRPLNGKPRRIRRFSATTSFSSSSATCSIR